MTWCRTVSRRTDFTNQQHTGGGIESSATGVHTPTYIDRSSSK